MPSMMKRFSPALAPSIERPPSLASWLAPGACVTSVVKSRPLRQQFDLLGADVRLPRALLDVDERRFGGDRHRFLTPVERHRELDRFTWPRPTGTSVNLPGEKLASVALTSYTPGSTDGNRNAPDRIRCRAQHDAGGGLGFNCDARQNCARRVLDGAFDGAPLFLGRDRPGQQQNCHQCGKCACSHWCLILLKKRDQCQQIGLES